MVENKSVFQEVIIIKDNSGELKTQYTVDLTPWDQSEMEGYTPREGVAPLKGYSCSIRTLKVNKKFPKSRIDVDPANKELRKAISDMYAKYDELTKK